MKPYTCTDVETDVRAAIDAGDEATLTRLAPVVDQFDVHEQATLHGAALWYASQGIHVFPLQPGTKIPLKGSKGCKMASTDPDLINLWWTGNPHCNVAIATGHLLDVIDIDGFQGVKSYLQLVDDLPAVHGKVTTPRPGGSHLYVTAVPGRGNKAALLPGIDYRGMGGYVVAPPSRNEQGQYMWRSPLDVAALANTLGGAA